MALKTYNPTSPGQRQLVLVDRSELHKGRPVKTLTEGLTKTGGRNNKGRMTARHKGGGAKRLYRRIDFKRNRWDLRFLCCLSAVPQANSCAVLWQKGSG